MAVAIESFSIREYAEKMRKVDMGKCWPFACEGREVNGRLLPPISSRKFRWWADELESERINDEAVKASLAEVDTCSNPARVGGRGKQKVPKKRSIVELFAVAPQVETVEEDDNGECDETDDLGDGDRGEVPERGEENVGFDLDEEAQDRNHGGHAVIRRKQIRLKRNTKQKKKKKITASKKVKSHTFKLSSAGVVSSISEYCSRKTKLKDPIGEHTKKKRAQVSKTGQNCKSIRALKLSVKRHDDCRKVAPLRSILKNRITSNKKTTVLASRLRCRHMKSCGELIKHVSFSDKDDILGPNKDAAPKELPQLQTLCKVLFSDVFAASAAIKNSSKDEKYSVAMEGLQVEKENMDVSLSSIRLADRPDNKKNHSSDAFGLAASIIDPNSSNYPDKVKNKTENFDLNKNNHIPSNLSFHMASYSTTLHCHQDSTNRQILDSCNNEDLSSNIRNHVQNNTSTSTPAVSNNSFHCRICVPRSDSTYSQTVTRNPVMQPSRSCAVSTMQNDHDSSQPSAVSNITESRPANLSSKYFSSSNCSSVGSMNFLELMRASDPMFFTREKIISEDFIGLPLNSQGELVKLDSSCDFINPFKKHTTVPGSFNGSLVLTHMEPTRKIAQENMKERFPSESIYAKDLLQVLPKQYCSSENQLTSCQGIAELHNFEGIEAEKFELVHGKDPYKVSCNACNLQNCTCQTDRSTYHPGMDFENNVTPQPTMRLMGTTVTIGEISKASKGFDDVKVWTDKKITTENFPRTSVYLGSYSEQWPEQEKLPPSALWASQDKLLPSSRDHQTLHHIPLVGPKLDRQQAQMAIGLSSTIVNHVPTGNNTALPRHPSPGCLHLTQQPLVHCDSVKRSIESVHPKPVMPSVSQDISHQWLLNYTHCKHTQSLSSSKSSASNNLFRNNTSGCFAEPSSVFSSPYHPQWLLNAKEQLNGQIIPFIRYPTPYVGYHPCSIPGTNFLSLPSPCSKSLNALPVYNIQTSNTCASSTSASLGHHSFVAGYPVNASISANNSIQVRRAQSRDGPKSKSTCLSAWNHGHKTKKRFAEKGHEFIRPLKKANELLPVKSCSISRQAGRGQQHMLYPRNIGTTGALHLGNETRNPNAQFLGYNNDEYRCFFESSSEHHRGISGHVQFSRAEQNVLKTSQNMNPSSSSPIYSSRLGPVKLRAGAKHVLKPCRNSDQKSSRLIHSATPLVDRNGSSRIVVSHKKLEEIYSF